MFPRVLRGADIAVRWTIWTVVIAALAMFALLPLQVAIGWSDFERIGFTARQIGGTIWYGRIGHLHLRSQPIGTLEVSLDPAALLLGTASMRFNRMDSAEGPLVGQLVAGRSRGVRSTTGRLAVGDMFAPLPVAALELNDVTVLFRNGQCAEASGSLSPILAAPIPGVELSSALSGKVECDGQRAHVRLDSASGAERFEFYISDSGDYRAWMSVRNEDPAVTATLAAFGFRASPEGLRLSMDGRL